ncbi:MAG: diguanylate cyclase [Hydrogenovibrio crunogenus]|uniref:GGDEF domain-containing protein n=1 Tax=Hydrogenovibrio crunogenus (strain DSM 25203 / XCL-2) TaxID=317025 RepID=Q31JG1_HYDCU|nr:diguanylate cyclase [Hydrogenovibrio crunogenus]
MSMDIIKPTGFRKFAFKKFIWVSIASILASLAVTTLVSAIYLGFAYLQATDKVHSELDTVLTQLQKANGNPTKIETLLMQVKPAQTQSTYHFVGGGISHYDMTIINKPSTKFAKLARTIEADRTPVQLFDVKHSALLGGVPLYYSSNCKTCELSDPQGKFIGSLLYERGIISPIFGTSIFGVFLLIFILNFFVIGVYMMTRTLEQDFIQPLKKLSQRIDHVRLDEDDMVWQRQPQKIAEIDMIDEMLTEHIQMLKAVHEKLDALMVTEHESGFFHQDRFKESLQFEIFRSERYKRPLSLIVIKLIKIISASSNHEVSVAEKIHVFADLINHTTRNVDMPFRVRDQLFVILMPEIDENDIRIVARKYYERFSQPSHTAADESASFNFKIEIGYASYGYDATTANELMHAALERLTEDPATEGEI